MHRLSLVNIEKLATAIRDNRSLKNVDLYGDFSFFLQQEALETLLEGLCGSAVTSLGLDGAHMGNEGVKVLARALNATSLKSLDLGSNNIGDEGLIALAAALKTSKLTTLRLSKNSFGRKGLLALAGALADSSLVHLALSGNDLRGSEEALLVGLRMSSVKQLELLGVQRMDGHFKKELQGVVESNRSRCFLLQLEVLQTCDSELQLKFRTLAGTEAALLQWDLERPVEELPKAALDAMQLSGFQVPFRGIRPVHLRIVCSDGTLLDVGRRAAPLARQLGISPDVED